ncbi:Peptidoglycan endopeptidase LytF precursor [Paraliobacillus sp. PM-2]|uniref:C40 family peptidase n=1 Tax=Paraliobacillus sp. PM-2 TaxID=1462524 RepID=UPI00061BECA7|nr:NlpC/P60 family protein [Paraliobacillus sp. PM-2]CQR46644.1 Peptidoglycan endopeptidase LytF precursor [Paraliobacillus sp. PM-2]
MLASGQIQHVVKHSMAYGYILSHPFSFYVDAYPLLQNEIFQQTEMQLSYGQHNESIRVLQQKLNLLSYYEKDLDGEFGIFTEYALKRYQAEHHLTVSGEANKETIAAIIRSERDKYLTPLQSIDRTYYIGETGEDIKSIQKALYYFGYYKDEADGIFGPKTNQALHYFQVDNGLEVKQEINPQVITALSENSSHQSQFNSNEKKETNIAVAKDITNESVNSSELAKTAKQYIGVSYTWGGSSPSGFDCSGYINYVFNQLHVTIPRTVSDIWNMAQPVKSLSIGDLVFFETYKKGPSHMGIYLGNKQFIHASESQGVQISAMNMDYWQQRYLGAKRIKIK